MVLPNRHSIRLKNYDYSSCGAYFITICTQDREMLFGDIVNGKMKTNDLGNLMITIWESLSDRFLVDLGIYQIMPNHFHGIIIIDQSVGAPLVGALYKRGQVQDLPLQKITLGNIIGAFKSLSTNAWKHGKFWQRNYFEHVIRNDKDFDKISWYIENNPSMWDEDENNSDLKKSGGNR